MSLTRSKPHKIVWLVLLLLSPCFGFAQDGYRLGIGDVVKVEVWGEEELSGNYTVNDQGGISRSWLPITKVNGLSLTEATQALQKTLAQFLKQPRVKLEVLEYNSHRVNLVGGVNKPGQYTLDEKQNLLTVLLKAGGLLANARGQAIVLRTQGGESELQRISVDVSKLLNQGDTSQDLALLAGDVVYFPMAGAEGNELTASQSVVVTGAVNRMGSYPYREGYTALNAVLDAQGFTKFADPNRARIVRGQGKIGQTIRVELGDVVKRGDKTKDVVLQPGDILVVPEGLL